MFSFLSSGSVRPFNYSPPKVQFAENGSIESGWFSLAFGFTVNWSNQFGRSKRRVKGQRPNLVCASYEKSPSQIGCRADEKKKNSNKGMNWTFIHLGVGSVMLCVFLVSLSLVGV